MQLGSVISIKGILVICLNLCVWIISNISLVSRILRSTTVPFSVEFQPICDGIRDRTISLRDAIEATKQDGN